jgi:hypothetical protein
MIQPADVFVANQSSVPSHVIRVLLARRTRIVGNIVEAVAERPDITALYQDLAAAASPLQRAYG